MVKDAPNYIKMNMIGLDQTSREILKDGDILISPVVLITLKALRNNCSQSGSHYPPYVRRLIQSVYDCEFSASLRPPPPPCLELY